MSEEERERRLRENLEAVRRARQGPRRMERWLGRLGPAGAFLVFAAGKLKWVAMGAKLLKLHTLASMLLMIWVYSMSMGWPFAAGFVLLIFVHELGHALMMKRLGIPAGAPVFIPFVGAVIAMRGLPTNAWVEALVGIGGPVLGTLGALVCAALGFATDSDFWWMLATSGFLINLFNMLPVRPLDGGRVMGAINRWVLLLGYALGVVLFLITGAPMLALVLLMGVGNLSMLWNPPPGYYDIPTSRRVAMGAAYFGSLAVMAIGIGISGAEVAHLHEPLVIGSALGVLGRVLASEREDRPWAHL